MTLPEIVLWQVLRKRPNGYRFRRQFPVDGYVLDFACLKCRLAIEVDGEAHSRGSRPERDRLRDARLAAQGIATLRVAARDVLGDVGAVIALIVQACADRPPHHSASPNGPPPRSGEEL